MTATRRRRARSDIRTWTVQHEIASQTVTSRPLTNLRPRHQRGWRRWWRFGR